MTARAQIVLGMVLMVAWMIAQAVIGWTLDQPNGPVLVIVTVALAWIAYGIFQTARPR